MDAQITYNHGAVADLASNVGTTAGQLAEIHADVAQRTQALAEFFMGQGASSFFDAQTQALHGLEGLIHTVSRHGQTVTDVHGNAMNTDAQMANLFI
ncbi:MAG TPA: WXG100 family type VII secretion target [Mycobacterium sp.]